MTGKFLTTATAALVLSLSPALAQDTIQPQGEVPVPEQTLPAGDASDVMARGNAVFLSEQTSGDWLTSNLIGQEVTNPAGETLGEVAALEIGPDGKVVGVVIEAGGFLGLGTKLIGVPYESVQHSTSEPGNQALVVEASLDEIDAAPRYMTLLQKFQAEEAAKARLQAEQSAPLSATPKPMTSE